jgi:hypothetical protein
VREVNRPPRKGERRLTGKSDLLDAEHAARQVLSGAQLAAPKTADGDVESLRLLKIARDTAVKARTAAMIALKATLMTAASCGRSWSRSPITSSPMPAPRSTRPPTSRRRMRRCGMCWAPRRVGGCSCTTRSPCTASI